MRSNMLNIEITQRMMKRFSQLLDTAVRRILHAAQDWLTLGVSGRQWLAIWLIGLLLSPVFSLPVSASVMISAPAGNVNNFEPVNAPQPFWETAYFSLNAKVEEWTTSMRNSSAVGGSDTDEKTKSKISSKNDKSNKDKDNKSVSDNDKAKKTEDAKKQLDIKVEKTNDKSQEKAIEDSRFSSRLKTIKRTSLLVNQPADRPILDDNEVPSLVSPVNNLGNPLGQTESSAPNPAVATSIRERAGIGNFGFSISAASLSGRNMDASVGISYNSQLWTKSFNQFTYNVDGNWLAPGFQIGYGYLDVYAAPNQFPSQIIVTDSDGTRHQLTAVQTSGDYGYCRYESNDGAFVKAEFFYSLSYNRANQLKVTYSDGTKVQYGSPNSQNRLFPVKFIDRQGNYIAVNYLPNDEVGKISFIRDTLGRDITFNYDTSSEQKLISISVPGYNGSPTPRQTIRFYYETMNLNTQNRFAGTIVAPTTLSVLRYVYFPGTRTGYRYDYSTYYGMIYKITRLDGMQVTTNVSTQMGAVTAGSFLESAWTRYFYAGTDIEPPSPTLNDIPKYVKRTDDWVGRDTATAAPQTFYNVGEQIINGIGTRTTTITSSDNTAIVSVANIKPGQWDDGLITETSVTTTGRTQPWAKTILTWQQGQITYGRRNPRVQKTEVINEAGQAQATTVEYDGYNNPTIVREYGFAPTGQLGTELRRTETSYLTGYNQWISNNLLRLPTSVKTIVNNTIVSRTDYVYDGASLADVPNVVQHEAAYNPNNTSTYTCNCRYECQAELDPVFARCTEPEVWVCEECPIYDSATDYRGNVTKITSFVDPYNNDDPQASVTTLRYDITGNTVEASLNCCNLTTWVYDNTNNGYAYPITETKGTGAQLTTRAEYDFNTGLITKTKDENNQETIYEYEPDTLRQKKVIYPNGGYTLTEYSDKLISDSAQLVPGFVRQTTTLETNKTVQSYSYYDGRGAGFRNATQTPDGWSVSAVEFDALGRPIKSYNPFYASTPTGAIPSGTKFTEVVNYDALSRTTNVKLQDNTTVSTTFNGTTITVTDQAGKQRRQLADALGRIMRVDEPDANGNLDISGVPAQPTSYEYDGNDNLVKVIQTGNGATQERKFKYDALSRLTHEKQVEANATLDDNGVKGAIAPTKWTKFLKYNPQGLLLEGTDARGVKTTFAYDGLNRVSTVGFTDGTPQITYIYDQARTGFFNNGALTRVETAQGDAVLRPDTPATATEFDYDKMGRVVKHRQSISSQTYALEYGYNLAGQLTSEKYPSGKIVSMNYDANGRLSSIADASRNYLSGVSFNSRTLPSQINFGNGTNQTFAYNDRLQMTQQNLSRGTEVLQKYDYGYGQIDALGNLDATKNNGQLGMIESYIGAAKQFTQKFSYDSIGRLSEAKEYRSDTNALSYNQKFDFDRFGNLYRKVSSNPTAGQATPLPFTPIEDADISKSTNRFTTNTVYDDAGNVTQDTKFRNQNFSYDANGRMFKTSSTSTANQANSVYDASGIRVATQVDNVWTFFVYDVGGKMVAEYGGVPATDEGGVKYVMQDWQGSSRTIVSNSGFVQARMDYQAFGEEINSGIGQRTTAQGFGSLTNLRQKYGLTERDEATGLDHTWFRKNENKAGRWTSPDPYNGSMSLGNPQSFNRYSYVENQPTNFVDPSGLLRIDCNFVGQIIIGDFRYNVYQCVIYDDGGGFGGGRREPPDVGGGGGGGGNPGGAQTGNCGVNPVTKKPGINPKESGKSGELRPGKGGKGGFKTPRNNKVGYHTGIDIAGDYGDSVFAAMGGEVTVAGSAKSKKKYGLVVSITHPNGFTTRYAHLSGTNLKTGDMVEEGVEIGKLGTSGNASNLKGTAEEHVHFEVRDKNGPTNPVDFLNSPCPK